MHAKNLNVEKIKEINDVCICFKYSVLSLSSCCLANVSYYHPLVHLLDMPQTSELRLSPSMPPAVVAKSPDAKICNLPGCIHTGK